MKLILAIINDSDAAEVTRRMLEGSFTVTKIGSSGGIFKGGMTTLLCAAPDGRVPNALEVLKTGCKPRKYPAGQVTPESVYAFPTTGVEGVTVGGATVFVLNVEESFKF